MYQFIIALFIIINLTAPVLGAVSAITDPYTFLSGHAKIILYHCNHDQGVNVENEDFDMETLCVTKTERRIKFRDWDDYKPKNPTKHPYEVLLELLQSHDITPGLETIQRLDDEQRFLEVFQGAKKVCLNLSYKKGALQDYKLDLFKRFQVSQGSLVICAPRVLAYGGGPYESCYGRMPTTPYRN